MIGASLIAHQPAGSLPAASAGSSFAADRRAPGRPRRLHGQGGARLLNFRDPLGRVVSILLPETDQRSGVCPPGVSSSLDPTDELSGRVLVTLPPFHRESLRWLCPTGRREGARSANRGCRAPIARQGGGHFRGAGYFQGATLSAIAGLSATPGTVSHVRNRAVIGNVRVALPTKVAPFSAGMAA